jgi:phosphomannomutase
VIDQEPQIAAYRCPEQRYPISRAVHLGRLASFYPGCRQCAHRDDTGTLSPRQVRLLAETRARGQRPVLFHGEGAGGVYRNDLDAAATRNLAAAMGILLQRRAGDETSDKSASRPGAEDGRTAVALAGDARPLSAELVAAASEGLRWTGCDVVDLGPASAACLASAIHDLGLAGGILVGNPGCRPQYVGMQFWDGRPGPFSAGGPLDLLRGIYESGADRPTRGYGSLRRHPAETAYLAGFAPRYHGLRPLRLLLDSACGPMVGYLHTLTRQSACQIITANHATGGKLAEQVQSAEAHLAAQVDGDGETCHVLDEQGRAVPTERLLVLLARHVLATRPQSSVVLTQDALAAAGPAIEAVGGRVVYSEPSRGAIAAAMRQPGGLLGGTADGRFWYALEGPPQPDALLTLTLLLGILSQSDRPLSDVLARLS